jgi:inosine-uridine nucleoside N-ribohydrolase
MEGAHWGRSALETRNVIIDTDPGVDDAMALLLALRSPVLNVLGITTVAGNLVLSKTTRNALVVVEISGRRVPVYPGASQPLMEPLDTAEHAHGMDGLGDIGLPDPLGRAEDEHAVDFIVRTAMASAEPLHLITLGPLTNVALALCREPRLQERVQSLTMMAGSWSGGNLTPVAEFNAGADPEATAIVLRSRIPKTMVALDPISEGATIELEDVDRLEHAGTPWCDVLARLFRKELEYWPQAKLVLCDPAAVGVAVDPRVAEVELLPVAVETRGQYTRGMTVVDFRRGDGHRLGILEPNVNVVLRFHSDRFRELVMSTYLGS